MLKADEISFAYDGGLVLEGAGMVVGDGEVVGLIGPNGSGKTTFLRILYAALRPRTGAVMVDDVSVAALAPRDVARRLSVVIQEGSGDLPLTVSELVILGRSPHLGSFERYKAEDYRLAAAALHRVGARHLADRAFAFLSGGEKQRVLIAKALAQGCRHLLLDEPTNHLDIRYQHEVLSLIRSIGTTSVVVLHDLNLASRYCDRLVLLQKGRVVATGTCDEVLRPEVLEPVYEIGVRCIDDHDGRQLLFRPLSAVPTKVGVGA